jgi:hypothetical protein
MTPQSVTVVVGLWVAGGPGLTVWPPGTAVGVGSPEDDAASDGSGDGEAAATSDGAGLDADGLALGPVVPQAATATAIEHATRAAPARRRGADKGRIAGPS